MKKCEICGENLRGVPKENNVIKRHYACAIEQEERQRKVEMAFTPDKEVMSRVCKVMEAFIIRTERYFNNRVQITANVKMKA